MLSGHVPDDEIARLIRATIEADARQVDVQRLEAGVCERLAQQAGTHVDRPNGRHTERSLSRRTLPRLAVAAAILVAIGGVASYLTLSATQVQAYALVRSVQAALGKAADREYVITFDRSGGLPILSSLDEARLWTRGDRYRVQFTRGGKQILWGMDDQQRFWVVSAANKVLLFEPTEIPREFEAMLAYLSLDLKNLTDQILEDCELTLSAGMRNRRNGLKTVEAVRKADSKLVEFSTARMEIDETTKTIRRLNLSRRVNGKDQGRCEFTLIDDAPQSDDSYRHSTHVAADATVLDKSQHLERMAELFRLVRDFRSN